jgi:LysM repeat protein
MKAVTAKITLVMFLLGGLATGCATKTEPEPEATPPPAETKAEKPAEAPPMETPVAAQSSDYTVQKGDNLWNIAGRADIYDNAYQWPLIYRTNQAKIRDADLIFPGQAFSIDRNPSSADVSAAVNHAKTRGAWVLGQVEASDKAYLAK